MRKFLATSYALISILLIANPANAQASRTWVSGTGDDVNPCSRTAPCKTFAGAISKTAVNGEINCLDPGGFGAVTITKSITLDCNGTIGSILNAGTNGINIAFDSFAATDVRKTVNLRQLALQGFDSGITGIRILGEGTGSFVNIEDSVINGNFSSTATGIADNRKNGALTVVNTTVRDMGGSGIAISGATGGKLNTMLSNVRIINSNTGITAGLTVFVHLSRSVVVHNATSGLTSNPGSSVSIDSSTISFNGTGLTSNGSVWVSNSDLGYNTHLASGTFKSFTTNRLLFNGTGGTIVPAGASSPPTGFQ